MTRNALRLAALALTASLTVACVDTVVEVDSDAADSSIESGPSTTAAIVGTPGELLDEMATAMSSLNYEIAAGKNQRETLDRISAIWDIARPEVESTNPELINGIDTTVEMARTGVVRIRPADADRAFLLLAGLVERYHDA